MAKRRQGSQPAPTRSQSRASGSQKHESQRHLPQERCALGLAARVRMLEPVTAWCVGMLLVWACWNPADSVSVFRGEALPQNLFWLFVAVGSGVVGATRGRLRWTPLAWTGSLCGLAWLLVVTVLACDGNNPRPVWNGCWQVIAIFACYVCCRGLIRGPATRAALVCVVIGGCAAQAGVGLHQVVWGFPQQRALYEADPEGELAKIPLIAPEGSPQRARFESRLYSPEPYGHYSLANSLATLLTAGLVLMLPAMWLFGQREQTAAWRVRFAVGLALLLLMAICWLLTRSRTAWLALLAAAGYWVLARWVVSGNIFKRSRAMSYAVGGGALAIGAALFWMARNDQLVLSEAPKSLAFRLEYWLASLRMLSDHWLFGIGLGNFQSFYPQYKLELASETVADPHNLALDLAVNLSLPLAMLILVWLARHLWPARTTSQQTTESDRKTGRAVLFGALVGGLMCIGLLLLLQGIDGQSTAIGCCLGLAAAWASWPGVLRLVEQDLNVLRAASVAGLVCLLASGSWQAAGIALPLMVFLAASHGDLKGETGPTTEQGSSSTGGAIGSWAGAAVAIAGLGVFVFQTWMPVTTSWALMQQAENASGQRRIALIQQAFDADGLNTDRLAQLGEAKLNQLLQTPPVTSSQLRRQVDDLRLAIELWLDRDRHKFVNWKRAGDQMLMLATEPQRSGLSVDDPLELAQNYYQRAWELYPSSVQLRVQLAATAALRRDWATFDQQLEEAERISGATPHLDKQLASQLIWMPLPAVPDRLRTAESGSVPAELLIDWLRSTRATAKVSSGAQ